MSTTLHDECPSPRPASAERGDPAPERGAVLAMMVGVLAILMLMAGLVIDISSKENRAQDLQNAADAAALAGAQVWADGDENASRARVMEILSQNGVGSEFVESIEFPTLTTVQVNLSDTTGGGLLAPFTGGLSEVSRDATATHVACSRECDQLVVAPPIFRAVEALGSGDGFLPIAYGDRLYSINHHENGVACVDKFTQQRCWPTNRAAFNDGTLITSDNHHPTLIDDKIFYLGTNGYNDPNWWSRPTDVANADLVLGCFNLTLDQICGSTDTLTGEGFGLLAGVNGQLHLFTTSRNVYCYDADFTPCAGHSGARDSQTSGLPDWDLDGGSVHKADLKVVGDRIYYTMSNDGEVWVQCWNAAAHAPCSTFGPIKIPGSGGNFYDQGNYNKVVLGRSLSGAPQDFCIVGYYDVYCWDLDTGVVSPTMESDLDAVRSLMRANGWDQAWSGVTSYHEPTNQAYLVDSQNSRSYCFSFTTRTTCGDSDDVSGLGVIHTYGYIEESPSCLIGLGDNSIFFSMKPDLSGPCDSSGGFVDLIPCNCLGEPVWPRIAVFQAEGVVEFNIRVLDPDGNEIIPWTDILLTDVDLVDAPDVEYLRAEFNVVVEDNANPWLEGNPPEFQIIGETVPPYLTE